MRLATYASRCIENEILMYFRSRKKTAGDVSLSEALDADGEGNGLQLMDVVAAEEDLADQIGSREQCESLRAVLDRCLDQREARIIRLRYGLGGRKPLTQLETAERCGISRSYVSRLEKRAMPWTRSVKPSGRDKDCLLLVLRFCKFINSPSCFFMHFLVYYVNIAALEIPRRCSR